MYRPVSCTFRALYPIAVLPATVEAVNASKPTAVLLSALTFASSAYAPTDTLLAPVVFAVKAL